MREYRDHLGRKVSVSQKPKRIISLVPSLTELLYDLGLDKEVVGVTKFCVHPKHWRKEKTVIGGTKNFKIDLIQSLNPDLIIANKEENNEEGILEVSDFCPVWVSDVTGVSSALDMISAIGDITGRVEEAHSIVAKIKASFKEIKPRQIEKAVYLIWQKPYMAAGSDTFISQMMSVFGEENLIKTYRYPEISLENIKALKPDVVLLSSEPYPFKEVHKRELSEALNCRVELVDGEIYSWYGSRMSKVLDYFKKFKMGKLQQLPLS